MISPNNSKGVSDPSRQNAKMHAIREKGKGAKTQKYGNNNNWEHQTTPTKQNTKEQKNGREEPITQKKQRRISREKQTPYKKKHRTDDETSKENCGRKELTPKGKQTGEKAKNLHMSKKEKR